MTIAMTPVLLQCAPAVSWRALEAGLWVARRDGKHLGSVQPGRRWLAADADGEPIGTFRSFREAQLAVVDPAAHGAPPRRGRGAGPALAALILASTALASVVGWVWTALVH